jgi:hypothetical protein
MAERKWFKGRAALELDRWFSRGDVGTNLIEARRVLLRDESFGETIAQLNAPNPENPENPNPENPWSTADEYSYPRHDPLHGPEFEAVARRGFLEAIALARRHSPPVPIRTFWMNGVGNETFEMHVADEEDQVAVTVLIPNDEGGSDAHGPESWVVSIDGEGTTPDHGSAEPRAVHVDVTQTSGPPGRPRPSTTETD